MACFSPRQFSIFVENCPTGVLLSIKTDDGVKVADVAWASDEFMRRNGTATPYEEAPEICIEIVSPSNSREEMTEKIKLYLAKGAVEVWLCGTDGCVKYFSKEGQRSKSKFTDETAIFR
jgi:Uma2 family endonuclease